MLVIRSKCMLEKQAEGLQRSTGTLPVHGCASDWPCLWYKAGFSAASVVEAADGVLAVAAGCPGVPLRSCPAPSRCWNHARPEDSRCRTNGAGKFPQSLRFVAVHRFSFLPFASLQLFFSGLRLSVTSSSFLVLLLFLLLFRNYVEGAEGGWASCLREGESVRMGRGEEESC